MDDLLLALLDQAFDHPSWHGTNLRGALRRLDPERAAWRPGIAAHDLYHAGQIQLLKRLAPGRRPARS